MVKRSPEAPERYHIAAIDFEHVSAPYIVSAWIIFASLAKIGFHWPVRKRSLSSVIPESCLLLLLGLVAGLALHFIEASSSGHHRSYVLDSHTFFQYLLPPIVLEAGYFMPTRAFFDNIGTILLFALVGTLFNATAIGFSIYAASELGLFAKHFTLDMFPCLLFGSLISAVDPVAVLSVLEEVHVHEVLHIIVFGESLLNDAVTVVLYNMFETYTKMSKEGNIADIDILAGIFQLFVVSIAGIGIGITFGIATALITRFTQHVVVVEPVLVFLMAYLSYLTAEVFHVSGIMAIVFCGMSMKQYVDANISHKSHTTIKYCLKFMSSCSEAIIFLFLGFSTVTDNHDWDTRFILCTIFFCLFYRAISTIILSNLSNRFRLIKINKVEQFIIAYGGLRGALSFSLPIVVSVPHDMRVFVTAVIAEIYFSILWQGMTIKPLVKCLNVKRGLASGPTMFEMMHDRIMDHLMSGVEEIAGNHGYYYFRDKLEYYNSKYIRKVLIRHRDKLSGRDHDIIDTYMKLNIREAMDQIHSRGSVYGAEMNRHRPYVYSVLDTGEVEVKLTKKDEDDARKHHLLLSSIYKPRLSNIYTGKQVAIIEMEGEGNEENHHRKRFVVRQVMSKSAARHNQHINTRVRSKQRHPAAPRNRVKSYSNTMENIVEHHNEEEEDKHLATDELPWKREDNSNHVATHANDIESLHSSSQWSEIQPANIRDCSHILPGEQDDYVTRQCISDVHNKQIHETMV